MIHSFVLLCWVQLFRVVCIGSLGSNNDDGSANIAKEKNLLSFQLYCVHFDPLTGNLLNVGIVPVVEFLRIVSMFRKGKENLWSYVHESSCPP